jgi:hypothetical protein
VDKGKNRPICREGNYFVCLIAEFSEISSEGVCKRKVLRNLQILHQKQKAVKKC